MKRSRFWWTLDKAALIDTKTGRRWLAFLAPYSHAHYFVCVDRKDKTWNGRESAHCTRRYTALRSLMRLIAKEDKKCAKPIKRMK